MAYQEPKTNWNDADTLQPGDTNRIEANIEYLAGNGGEQQLGKTDDVEFDEVSGRIATFTGSVECASINTGYGAFEIEQDVNDTGGDLSGHYTGSSASVTDLPVGSIVLVSTFSNHYAPNEVIPIEYISSGRSGYSDGSSSSSGPSLSGTWRSRGWIYDSNDEYLYHLAQRIS